MTLVLDKKQRNLLLASEATKEFDFLVKLLEKNDMITTEMVRKLDSSKQTFFRDSLSKLLQHVQAEWISKGDIVDLGNVATRCSICGTPNRYMHFIKNQISGKTLNIGSECAKKFFDDIKTTKKAIRNAQKLRRLTDFFEIFPSADKMIDSWISDLNTLSYLLPNHIESPYRNLCFRARSLIKEFQEDEKNSELIINEFKYCIEEHRKQWEKILKFQKNCKGQSWAATREIGKWLTNHHKNGVLALLKNERNNCLIGPSTFSEIWEPNYIKRIIPIINKSLSKIGIKVTNFEQEKNRFELRVRVNFDVLVTQHISHVLSILGPHVVGSCKSGIGKTEFDRILDGVLVSDANTMNILLKALNKIYLHYDLHIAYFHVEFNEVFIIDTTNKRFKTYDLQQFISKNIGLCIKYSKPSEKSLVEEILKSKDRWIQTKELNDIINERLRTHEKWYPTNMNDVMQLHG